MALDENIETFIIYIAALLPLLICPSREAKLELILVDKAPIEIFYEYSDYANVFSPNLSIGLPEYTRINNHAIKLEEGKEPPYGPIYSLTLVDLKILKTYIENYVKIG